MASTLTPHRIQRYGWVPDLPDVRDHQYSAPVHLMASLPAKVDLRPGCPAVYDQDKLGSCTANAIAGGVQFERMRQKLADADHVLDATPSRLFIYYNERVIEGDVPQDNGAQIRDGIKSVATLGVCFEGGADAWPYDIARFASPPPAPCFAAALGNKITQYSRLVPVLSQLKGCLADGYPFVFGFTVYESFESAAVAQSGVLNLPQAGESAIGGHAVLAVGYDDTQQRFLVRNSWGSGWGQAGYFTMPYAYLTDTNLSDDFWTVRMVQP